MDSKSIGRYKQLFDGIFVNPVYYLPIIFISLSCQFSTRYYSGGQIHGRLCVKSKTDYKKHPKPPRFNEKLIHSLFYPAYNTRVYRSFSIDDKKNKNLFL